MLIEYQCITINTPEFEKRRKRFSFLSKIHGWEISFWDAVDCRDLKESDYPSWASPNLKSGEVGIWWSTKNLYEYAIKKNLDFLFVFEDDTKIISSPVYEPQQNYDYVLFNDRPVGFDGYCVSKKGMKKLLDAFGLKNGAWCPIDIFVTGSPADYPDYVPDFENKTIEFMVKHDKIFKTSIQET